jgi:Uncharacterized conserved protein, contains double-stranded beta-helix domain
MSYFIPPDKWREFYGSGTFPELGELYRQILERKRQSRLIMKASEVKWDTRHPQARSASLIDPRLGFANSFANLGLSEIDAGMHTGRHKHAEALIYVLKGRGYSIIGDRKVEWEEGDALYIPPDTYHQHFNTGSVTVRYLRVVPGILKLNLLNLAASLNFALPYEISVAEARPGYEGPAD